MGVLVLLHLVRHARPVIVAAEPASSWRLDPAGFAAVERLRPLLDHHLDSVSWHSSNEPKARETAQLLTDEPVAVVPELREAFRGSSWFPHQPEFQAAVLRGFAEPTRPAMAGWEPLRAAQRRVAQAVAAITADSATDVVLVGHGTAWTLLVSELTGKPPDLEAWGRMSMPDLCSLDLVARTVTRGWGDWEKWLSA